MLDPKQEDEHVESISRNGGIDVWKMWAKPILDENRKRPGTIRSYLCSLGKFCEFIVDQVKHKVSGFPKMDAEAVADISNMISRFKAMFSSVSKVYSHEKWEKQLDDEEKAVDPSVAENIMEMEPAKQAIKYLQLSFYDILPSEKEFLIVRDFLIARLALENC